MKSPASSFCFFLVFLVAPVLACAAPNGFQMHESNGGEDFTYAYSTPTGATQTLSVRLNMGDISRGSREFTAWDDDAAKNYAFTEAQKAAATMGNPNLKISVEKTFLGGTRIEVAGRGLTNQNGAILVAKIQNDIQTAYNKGIESYAANHYYRTIQKGSSNKISLMPNHATIARRYTAAMGPVATAIRVQVPGAADSPRNFINAALNWLQTIPYDTLMDRYSSNGAGFQTPYGLMEGNLGDCDTKATALAALIRAAYPTIPLTMVYVPEHAFLGVGIPQTNEDYALKTTTGIFVLADATGPGLTPLGYIDERTRSGIRSHQTELLPIP